MPATANDELLDIIEAFLTSIGLPPVHEPLESSLMPGVTLRRGQLVVDRARVEWPGDLLHEAGHLAVTPAALRSSLDDMIPVERQTPHGGEAEATAWAFAAVTALNLPPSVLFHAGGYHGRSEALIFSYTMGSWPGAGGLCATGMAASAADAAARGVASYPHMLRWLRD